MSHEAIYALIYGEKPTNSFRNWEDRNMSEPTLEEKLKKIQTCEKYFSIKSDLDFFQITVEIDDDIADFENIIDAINWLYETSKREGYLG